MKSRWLLSIQVILLVVCMGLLAKAAIDLDTRKNPQDLIEEELLSATLPVSGGEMSRDCMRFNRYITEAVLALREAGTPPPFTTAPLHAAIRRGECHPDQEGAAVILDWLSQAYDGTGMQLPAWSDMEVPHH